MAASRQPWPLPSRVEFHFEPFSYTFLHASWNPSWRQDRPSWSQDGAKLPNLAPRWAQGGNLRPQHGQLETILGSILPTFWDLGRERPDSKKPLKTQGFFYVFGGLGGALGDHVASSWRHVGLCWASWALSWSNLATR